MYRLNNTDENKVVVYITFGPKRQPTIEPCTDHPPNKIGTIPKSTWQGMDCTQGMGRKRIKSTPIFNTYSITQIIRRTRGTLLVDSILPFGSRMTQSFDTSAKISIVGRNGIFGGVELS